MLIININLICTFITQLQYSCREESKEWNSPAFLLKLFYYKEKNPKLEQTRERRLTTALKDHQWEGFLAGSIYKETYNKV